MERYVRTKDTEYGAIIDTKKYKEITGEDCYIPKDEIVAEAGTIEELCDEFVYIVDGCEPEVSDELDLMQTKSTIIYGAIWTDKGLIYVAKINEKGVLVLL